MARVSGPTRAQRKEPLPRRREALRLTGNCACTSQGKHQDRRKQSRTCELFCEQHLEGGYAIEVIDLKLHPGLAADHQILAVPTLIRKLPESIRMVIGTLADTERVLVGLDIAAAPRSH